MSVNRAGSFIRQSEGFKAFIPSRLPPVPPIKLDDELTKLLSDADRALGRLDGATSMLPNPDLFVAMYVRQEAVFSSQIEGTQSSLQDILEFESSGKASHPKDVEEVVNYVRAMNLGLEQLETLPLSMRLIRDIHAELMSGVRGGNLSPGEFRSSQNWIGPAGCTLQTATFVPPPVHAMNDALNDLEKFLHASNPMPALVRCGIAHAQFETIHPFLDGNGRVGRLLITFLLCEKKILKKPLLYLSHYLKKHRETYYDQLTKVRETGDWESWLKFFLQGVYEVSEEATVTTSAVLALQEKHKRLVREHMGKTVNAGYLLDHLFEQPILSIGMAQDHLKCSYGTVSKLMDQFCEHKILEETTGNKRNRRFLFSPYLKLFHGERGY